MRVRFAIDPRHDRLAERLERLSLALLQLDGHCVALSSGAGCPRILSPSGLFPSLRTQAPRLPAAVLTRRADRPPGQDSAAAGLECQPRADAQSARGVVRAAAPSPRPLVPGPRDVL